MALERVVPEEEATICGHFFPGGTIVGMSPYIVNRYQPTWGEDADIWRPRHWLDGEPAHVRKLEASLLSFGAGTRVCLGQNVAMFEIKKLVAALFMNYDAMKLTMCTETSRSNLSSREKRPIVTHGL
ncbi:cytochrome P450 protein [Rutstroemia sp. NJR-2017a BBW]|nr:cytochrome P450 protein [Rutstroemia sp. NJR-2017a BBW]